MKERIKKNKNLHTCYGLKTNEHFAHLLSTRKPFFLMGEGAIMYTL